MWRMPPPREIYPLGLARKPLSGRIVDRRGDAPQHITSHRGMGKILLRKVRIIRITVRNRIKWKPPRRAQLLFLPPIPIITASVMVIGGANIKWEF